MAAVGLSPIPVAAVSFWARDLWVAAVYREHGFEQCWSAGQRALDAVILVQFVLLPIVAAVVLGWSARRARQRGAERASIVAAITSGVLLFALVAIGSYGWQYLTRAADC